MIDTVVFDLGNVLVDFCWEKAFHEVLGLEGEKFERVANATTRCDDWNLHDKGTVSDDEMLRKFISNDPGVEAEIRTLYDDLSILIEKRDYANDWIERLHRAGYKVFILSNFARKSYRQCVTLGKMDFVNMADGAVISYEEQQIKPEHDIYHTLLNRYSITAENAVFIDDRTDNVESAVQCGMNGIVFKTKEQVISDLADLGVVF